MELKKKKQREIDRAEEVKTFMEGEGRRLNGVRVLFFIVQKI